MLVIARNNALQELMNIAIFILWGIFISKLLPY
jgi:hypothetical protein